MWKRSPLSTVMSLSCDVINALRGKTLVTAESCTGGGIGAALTEVAGSSAVYKGGIICYCNEVKNTVLGVSQQLLQEKGAVSVPVAAAMASGVRSLLKADVSVSVTGLAGPGGDDFGNPVGTVFIGYESDIYTKVYDFVFSGDRESVRAQAVAAALHIILENEHE